MNEGIGIILWLIFIVVVTVSAGVLALLDRRKS